MRVSLPFPRSFLRALHSLVHCLSVSLTVSSPIVCARVGGRDAARPLHRDARRVRACKTSATQVIQGLLTSRLHAVRTIPAYRPSSRPASHAAPVRGRYPPPSLPWCAERRGLSTHSDCRRLALQTADCGTLWPQVSAQCDDLKPGRTGIQFSIVSIYKSFVL